jgi:hypothetical protein
MVLTEEDCIEQGGDFRDDLGAICDPNPCPQGPPAGCSHGEWKHFDQDLWMQAGYHPDDLIGDVFTVPMDLNDLTDDSLYDALRYGGGPQAIGGGRILLRHAVASLLNAAHPEINFVLTETQVLQMVNEALASMDRHTMLQLKDMLEEYNHLGCPLTDDDSWNSDPETEDYLITGDQTEAEIHFSLPNPFRPNTMISLDLHSEAYTMIEIYNVHGQRIRTLFAGELSSGHHEMAWDGATDSGQAAGPGIYYVHAKIGRAEIDRKILLVK